MFSRLPARVGSPTCSMAPVTAIIGWAGQATRVHHNMLESLVLFAVAIIVAKLVNVSNAMTVLGAMLFFWGRVAHAVIYLIGIPWLRTAAWAVSIVGLLMILAQLAT